MNEESPMKMIYCLIIIFFSGHSISAKEIELSLWEARNFSNTKTLDSVKVSFEAKGHKLVFEQTFPGNQRSQSFKADQFESKGRRLGTFQVCHAHHGECLGSRLARWQSRVRQNHTHSNRTKQSHHL
jgi:hypothetical protein